jgi:hypothetical protein
MIVMSDVWKEINSGCMNEMCQKLCPQHVHDIHGFNTEEHVKSQLAFKRLKKVVWRKCLNLTKWSCPMMVFSSLKSNVRMRGKKKLQ